MPDPLFERLRGALSELLRLAEQTRRDEAEAAARLGRLEQEAHERFTAAFEERKRHRDEEVARLDLAYKQTVHDLDALYAREKEAERAGSAASLARLDEAEQRDRKQLQAELREALWTAGALLEAGQKRVQAEEEALRQAVEGSREETD